MAIKLEKYKLFHDSHEHTRMKSVLKVKWLGGKLRWMLVHGSWLVCAPMQELNPLPPLVLMATRSINGIEGGGCGGHVSIKARECLSLEEDLILRWDTCNNVDQWYLLHEQSNNDNCSGARLVMLTNICTGSVSWLRNARC